MEASEKYVEGFNSGYIIRRESPELAKKLLDALKEQDDYIQGLKDGKEQFERELDIEIERELDRHNKDQSPSIDKGKEHDEGVDYEP